MPICVSGHRDEGPALTGTPTAPKAHPAPLWIHSHNPHTRTGPCTNTRRSMCTHGVQKPAQHLGMPGCSPSTTPAAGTRKHQHSLSPRHLPAKGGPRSCSAPGSESGPCRDGTARHRSSSGTDGGRRCVPGEGQECGRQWRRTSDRTGRRAANGSFWLGTARLGSAWLGSARHGSARHGTVAGDAPAGVRSPSQPISLWDPSQGLAR